MARLANIGKSRPSGRARHRRKRSSPIKSTVRCIEFFTCLLAFGVLLLLALDAALHPHSREAISMAIILSGCAFARVSYDLRGFWLRDRGLGSLEMHAIDRMRGIEFEEVCAEIFRRNGFRVATTKSTGIKAPTSSLKEGRNAQWCRPSDIRAKWETGRFKKSWLQKVSMRRSELWL